MTTLVTGGAGFVGKHLVAALEKRGEEVRVFDLDADSTDGGIKGSILDRDAAAAACANVDAVFHLAGNAQLWARDAAIFDQVNHQGAQVMLEEAKAAGVRRFVHCSSLTTLVGDQTPIGPSAANEDILLKPDDMLGPYPRSKLMAELAVIEAARDGLDAVIAIPTEPLGPGDDSLTPPTQMILDFLNGATPAYIDCMLNFVPVESLAEGLIAVRDRGRKSGRYLLGGENISMRQLLEMISNLSGEQTPKTKLPYHVALVAGVFDTGLVSRITGKPPKAPLTGVRLAGRQVSFSSEKAAADLGWRAGSVEAALKETIDWFESSGFLKQRKRA